jgi:hypothetical protein
MANSFEHISIAAVKVLAQLAARKAVESELRAKGQRFPHLEVLGRLMSICASIHC